MDIQARSKLVKVIFLSQSLFSAGVIAIFTVLSISAFQLSGKESLAGLPSSVLIFSQALTAFPISQIINRFGWRIGLTIGYFLGAVGATVGAFALINGSFMPLLIASGLLGFARASGDLSRYAAGQMFEESKRAQMIGRVVFASAIGSILGPGLLPFVSNFMKVLGFAPETGGWVIGIFLYLLASFVSFVFLKPEPNKISAIFSAKSTTKNAENKKKTISSILRYPPVKIAIISMVISQLVMVVLMVMTPLYIHKLNHGSEIIAFVLTAHTLGMFAFSAITGYLIDRFGHIPILFAGALVLASSAIVSFLSELSIVLAFAMFLLGLGWNFGYVAGSSLLASSLSQESRSKIQGITDTLIAFIAAFGSLGAGPLFHFGGYFSLSMAGLLTTILLFILIFYHTKHKAKIA